MSTTIRALNEKYVVEVRVLPARAKRNLSVTAAAFGVVGLLGFALILRGVLLQDVPTTIDAPLEAWLNGGRTDVLTGIMIGLAIVFGPVALPIVILVVVVTWSLVTQHVWRPLLLAAGTLTGVILAQIITHAVGRHRPPEDLMLLGTDTTFSFPSGHVLGACNFLLLFTYLVFSRRSNPRASLVAFVVVGLLIVAAAVSRVYLGYHWATDALASVALSLVILGAVIALDTNRTVRVSEAPAPAPAGRPA